MLYFCTYQNDFVAQLVEQLTLNQWVEGSSPSEVTKQSATYAMHRWFFCFIPKRICRYFKKLDSICMYDFIHINGAREKPSTNVTHTDSDESERLCPIRISITHITKPDNNIGHSPAYFHNNREYFNLIKFDYANLLFFSIIVINNQMLRWLGCRWIEFKRDLRSI